MSDLLYFNGVNGATGSYGLEPMTSRELSDHVLGASDQESEERQELEAKLKRATVDKITGIVRLLAESNATGPERSDVWHSAWLKTLTQELAALLLGDEYTEPGRLKALEARLKRHTVDKIVLMVKLLAKNKTKELAALLLQDQDQEPDSRSVVTEEQIGRDARSKIDDVRKKLLGESNARDLERNVVSRSDWLEMLIKEMKVLPVEYLRSVVKIPDPLKTLTQELDRLVNKNTSQGDWLDMLSQELEALPRRTPWSTLLDTLQRGLDPLTVDRDAKVLWNDLLTTLNNWLAALRKPLDKFGVIEGIDPTDLAQAGWGVIFPHQDPQAAQKIPQIKESLAPLLSLRESQAGEHFEIYEKGKGYRPNDTASKFLARHGASVSNPVDPEKVPYYLLIVGGPEEIPFHFQYQLDVQYAVGRIDFGDDFAAYANYARSIVAAETGDVTLAPKITFFGVDNPDDRATELSAKHLVQPLYEHLQKRYAPQWQIDAILRDEATKARLLRLIGGEETPAFLFVASHGLEFPIDDPKEHQVRHQGALLCQDWRGPNAERGEIPQDYYLAGDDLTDDTNLLGMIAFFFACYGAGTPRYDEFSKQAFKERREVITEQPFIAALPKAMLSLSKGGALAVIGHVERAWGSSFLGPRQSEQIAVFQSAVERLLKGHPVGSAMEYFNTRYAALSTELTHALELAEDGFGPAPDPCEIAGMWTANNDARGYIVVGDPAVRLPVASTTG